MSSSQPAPTLPPPGPMQPPVALVARPLDADAKARRRRLGEVLIDEQPLPAAQREPALAQQRSPDGPRRRLGQVVADLGYATEREVAEALATHLGLEAADLSRGCPAPAGGSR